MEGLAVVRAGTLRTAHPGRLSLRTGASTMAVVVTDRVTQTGSQLSGQVKKIVLVTTDPGYGPSPGHDVTTSTINEPLKGLPIITP